MSAAENHARLDDMGGTAPPAWDGRMNGTDPAEAEPPVAAATMLAALVQVETRLAEGFAAVLARQRVQEAQMAEFQAMLQEFRPLLEAAQRRLGGQSWRSRFNTGGSPG